MNIIIPSTGRAHKVKTLEAMINFPVSVTIVVREGDKDEYELAHPNRQILVAPVSGIRATRQWILENFTGKVVLIDDDLTFYRRLDEKKFQKATDADVFGMLKTIEAELDHHVHVGLSDKFMSHLKPRGSVIGARYNDLLAYNLDKFPTPRPTYRVECNEEHDMHLQLRTQGLLPCVLTEYTKTNQTYAFGGCSTWRTSEVELAAHNRFAELWPGIVSVVPSRNSISKYVTRINWKKVDENVQNANIHSLQVQSIAS